MYGLFTVIRLPTNRTKALAEGPGGDRLEDTKPEDTSDHQGCLRVALSRPLRTRMMGGVGAGGENPPATRLASFFHKSPPHCAGHLCTLR
ncbi:MAG: hypothetical protein NW224_15640 [Leptolyngbyaceae cyanobacterium bins.302]|nr:hypothetical protein [Leptolyngbyaceae cyanobacterium bins.302]